MKKIFIANWKLYCDLAQTCALAKGLREIKTPYEVVIAPTLPFLPLVIEVLKDRTDIHYAAQNCDVSVEGPCTGDISSRDVREIGVNYCIVGHSERRENGESDDVLQAKVAAIAPYIIPILCVGETLETRKIGAHREIVEAQITVGLRKLGAGQKAIISYEPRWAISSSIESHVATDENIMEMHACIKKLTDATYPVLYGGSVTPLNCNRIAHLPNVDGVLVGHASTVPESLRAMLT